MQTKMVSYISGSLLFLPLFFASFYAVLVVSRGSGLDQWLPKWDTLLIIGAIVLLERIARYRYAVPQRHMWRRDVISTFINVYVTGAATSALVLPVIAFLPELLFGRGLFVASPDQLGPLWLQVPIVLLLVSFYKYWMHRLQHSNAFLWELHSYHHRVTDLTAANTFVSHPIDFALRNVVIYLLLGLVGFDPFALLLAIPATQISGIVSHCGADVKGGLLNYVFVTPEVHRWHHAAKTPAGHKYAVNYGVEFCFWDRLFGTFHLPRTKAHPEQPEQIGEPTGLPDERSYLRLLLVPLGLYRPLPWFNRAPRVPG